MKSTRKMKWPVGSALLGMLLVSQAAIALAGGEISSKQSSMGQEQMGGAVMEAGSLSWRYGQAEEQLGRLIRDAGPTGSVDQPRFGEGIAKTAQLKWRQGAAESFLGAAITKDALGAFSANSIQPGSDVG